MRAAYAVLREAIALIGRSALSVLFAQSGGKTRVAALISRRFSSAARVRIEASTEPEDDDQNEGAYERGGFECAAPDPPRNG